MVRPGSRSAHPWLLFLTPVLWGATFPGAKLALASLDPWAFMAWTRLLGFVTIVAAAPSLGGLRSGDLRRAAAPGVLLGSLLFGGYALQTVGLAATTATNAGFITGLYVVFTPLLGLVLFRHRVGLAAWVAVALSVSGLALLSTPTLAAFRPHAGDVLVLASAVAWAGHVTTLARVAPLLPARTIAVAQLAVAAALHAVVATVTGWNPAGAIDAAPLLVLTGIVGTGIAYTLQIVAQSVITPARAAVILSGESLVSALLAMVWIGERLRAHQWLGGALILGAMALSELGARSRPQSLEAPVPGAYQTPLSE